jgi:hypothetical protein
MTNLKRVVCFADWMHAKEMWMDNPLVNVDGEAIDRLIVEYYRTAVKSMRVFAEIPGKEFTGGNAAGHS